MSTLALRVRQGYQQSAPPGTPRGPRCRPAGGPLALAWIFIYHGAGTLFGAFGGPGIHRQAEYFANVAHLQPATFFAVLGGIIECFGGAAVGLGVFGRIAALGLFGDMVIAMVTVTFRNGIVSSALRAGLRAQPGSRRPGLVVALLGTGRLLARRGGTRALEGSS